MENDFSPSEAQKKSYNENIVVGLISDEAQAIERYTYAIDNIQDEEIKKKLTEIREDEQEHLKELNNILFKI